jgi:predicted nucleic acid-binding protein
VIEAPDANLHVPALCDVEISAALRRALLAGAIDDGRALEAIEDYLDLSISIHGHRALIHRIVALRGNLSAYDATYVALAEHIDAALLTADRALVRAVRQLELVEVLEPEGI